MHRLILLGLSGLLAVANTATSSIGGETGPDPLSHASHGPGVEIVTGTHPVCESVKDALSANDRAYHDENFDPGLSWRNVWEDAAVHIPEWHFAGSISEAEFDFDNDRQIDRVTLFSFFNSYMQGSVAMVILGNQPLKPAPGAVDSGAVDFDDARYWFLPCQWDPKGLAIHQCPSFSQDNDGAGLQMPTRTQGQVIRFRGRYSRLSPMRTERRTYVIVSALDEAAKGCVAVIQPLPKKRFQRMCLLHVPPSSDGAARSASGHFTAQARPSAAFRCAPVVRAVAHSRAQACR